MSGLGTSLQAIAFAATIGKDAASFLMTWAARDADAIRRVWPEYNKGAPEPEIMAPGSEHAEVDRVAMSLGIDVDALCAVLLDRNLKLTENVKPEGWGKFDDQVIYDLAYEALCEGEGRFSVRSFARELDEAGLCIVGKGYNDPDLIKRFAEALDDQETVPSALAAADLTLIPVERDRGDGRQAHYGATGPQPWDLCKKLGWAQYGAAFSILRYLRRTKQPERDLKHARVYYGWLKELALIDKGEVQGPVDLLYGNSLEIFRRLVSDVLLDDECAKLGVTEEDKGL